MIRFKDFKNNFKVKFYNFYTKYWLQAKNNLRGQQCLKDNICYV